MSYSNETRPIRRMVDDSYDESLDPDYTLSNTTTVLNDDDDDDDIESDIDSDLDDDKDLLKDLQNDNQSLNNTTNDTLKNDPISDSPTLPSHFYSIIHKHELPRKLFHISIGFLTIYLHINGYKTKNVWQSNLLAVIIIFSLDLLRFNWPYFNHLYCLTVGFLMREREINSINGVIYFQIGLILTFIFQKQDVSIMSILLLSWSDTAASTIGRNFGYLSPKISNSKSLIGSMAAFITGMFSCYLFYGIIVPKFPQYSIDFEYNPLNNQINLLTLSLLSGFIASLSEAIDIIGIDDNLTIPLLSGIFLSNVIKLGK